MPQFSNGELILNGKYQIEKLLGEGAFGEVYLATHQNLKAARALKVLHKDGESGIGSTIYGNARLRFLQESKLGSRLGNHPRIIQVMDFDEADDLLVLALEYAPGGSLQKRLENLREEGKPMPVVDALRIAIEVAEGLSLLHEMDVVHRDLKPGNILFDKDGHAKVADFGLAQVPHGASMRSRFSQPEPHPGTPGFMSPEQVQPPYDVLTPASDIYALGAVLFEMLTGRSQHMQRPGTQPSDLRPEVPAELDDLVIRMLAETPQERPWDGAETARLLGAIEQDLNSRHAREAALAVERARLAAELEARRQAAELEKARLEAEAQARQNAEEQAGRVRGEQQPVKTELASQADIPNGTRVGSKKKIPIWGWLLGVPVLLGLLFFVVKGILPPASATPELTQAPLVMPTAAPTVAPTTASVVVPTALTAAAPTAVTVGDASVPPACTEVGQTWVSPVDGMTLVCVPAGKFSMGSNNYNDEKPVHDVYLDAYWIDQTEVTNAQYAQCVAAGSCYAPYATFSNIRDSYYGDTTFADYPVIFVTWKQAAAYCAWAGRGLPSEAQWEKAARGTDGRKYPWGDSFDGTRVNFSDKNTNFDWSDKGVDDGYADTAPVGSYPNGASPYGALDMAGNVWEWTADWYGPYPSDEQTNPVGPSSGEFRVLRGGGWDYDEDFVRSSFRTGQGPVYRNNFLGFR